MTQRFDEARRLHAAGFKLCELHPMSKQPVGDGWNTSAVKAIRDDAGGYGLPLAVNGLCSIDFDNDVLAREGLRRCGFDPDDLRAEGVSTSSTRPGSGGRVAFRVPAGAKPRWIRFTGKKAGTILELRAASTNLQDCLPGTTYMSKGGGPWVQDYAGFLTFDIAPELPPAFLAWWQRMTEDFDYLLEQQALLVGEDVRKDISDGGAKLAFSSAHRMAYNASHDVVDILLRHGYTKGRNGRYAPITATGAASVRLIPGRDELWQSDHASDPLFGTFDAWSAHVVLDHDGVLSAAETVAESSRAVVAMDGFDEVPVAPSQHALYGLESVRVSRVVNFPEVDDDEDLFGPLDADLYAETPDDGQDPGPMPAFERDRQGKIKATINNLLSAIRRSDIVQWDIGLDLFRDEIMVAKRGSQLWRSFADADYVTIRSRLEMGMNGFAPIGREMIRDAVLMVADENKFDSAITWLKGLPRDGKSRIETFLIDYFGAEDTPYVRAVSAYLWTALAGRVLSPGCKADMVPIFVGNQGVGKSTAVAALAPAPEFFAEISFAEKDDNLSRKMRGKLVAEIGELRGLHTKELEAIKAFITRTHENWVPKFREFETSFPRRLVFIGTTNKDQFLADETGNRRWLPVRVGRVDVRKVREVAPLCWAEAALRFQQGGVLWQDAQRLGLEMHDEFAFHDEWEEKVRMWLQQPGFDDESITTNLLTSNVLVSVLGMESKNIKRGDEMRMGSVLRKLGFERKRVAVDGAQRWRYVPTSGEFALLENK